MRARARAAGLLLVACAALATLPDRPAAAQEVRYTRSLEVAEAGWVRVPLAPEVLRRAGPGPGLRLFGPEGEDVPFRRVPAEIEEPPPPGEDPPGSPDAPEGASEGPGPRSFRLLVPGPDCGAPAGEEASPASPRGVCRLALAGAGRFLRRLCFTAVAAAPAGHRLLAAREGRWEVVGEGLWSPRSDETRRCVPLELTLADPSAVLRLELYGGGEEGPAIREAAADFLGEDLLFRARRPGLHTLAYGPGVARSSRSEDLAIPPGARATLLPPGPEEAAEVPAEGPPLPRAAGPATPLAFDETWEVTADDPEPGRLHRLVVPPEVYAVAAPAMPDLRLVVRSFPSEVQVPYLRWRPSEPVLAGERRGAEPAPADAGAGRVDLELEAAGLPLSARVVSAAPAGGASLRVRVLAVEPGPGGSRGGTRPVSPWLDWDCRPRPPLPCRMTVALDGSESRGSRVLAVEIDDRGGEVPPAVDLELWRTRDVLLFAWPSGAGEGGPLLGAGAPDLEAPDYELEERLDELLAMPWQEARVVADGGGEGRGRLGAWALTLALLAAAAALVALLHRLLAEQTAGTGRG